MKEVKRERKKERKSILNTIWKGSSLRFARFVMP